MRCGRARTGIYPRRTVRRTSGRRYLWTLWPCAELFALTVICHETARRAPEGQRASAYAQGRRCSQQYQTQSLAHCVIVLRSIPLGTERTLLLSEVPGSMLERPVHCVMPGRSAPTGSEQTQQLCEVPGSMIATDKSMFALQLLCRRGWGTDSGFHYYQQVFRL